MHTATVEELVVFFSSIAILDSRRPSIFAFCPPSTRSCCPAFEKMKSMNSLAAWG
jgi:hypothetical protein